MQALLVTKFMYVPYINYFLEILLQGILWQIFMTCESYSTKKNFIISKRINLSNQK